MDAAVENGVKYIAYTGIPYTILRDNWYTEVNQALIRYAAEKREFEKVLGRKLTPLAEAVKEIIG